MLTAVPQEAPVEPLDHEDEHHHEHGHHHAHEGQNGGNPRRGGEHPRVVAHPNVATLRLEPQCEAVDEPQGQRRRPDEGELLEHGAEIVL